jgi:cell division protease FtsH
MQDNRVVIDLIVDKLLDEETLDGDEFRELLSTYTVLPNKNAPYVSKFTSLSPAN